MIKFYCMPEKLLFSNHLKMGGKNAYGEEITVSSKYLMKNNKPWLPVMGEIHFSRIDLNDWETEILKMKAGGITIIATYVFWLFHEETEGTMNFSNNFNIKEFIKICQKHGMFVFLRIGSWCHGEVRNGGFPDWLLNKNWCLRDDDPSYLKEVKRYYTDIYHQVKDFLFKNGGNIIGIQIENELADNSKHLASLKNIALDIGFEVPLYTVTGWGGNGGASIPHLEVIPVYGGYPEAPWADHLQPLEPNNQYLFYHMRNDPSIGADIIKNCKIDDNVVDNSLYPFITCEIGGGVCPTHHRRPSISADDVAAIALVKLGSGNNLPGYYMYHGGKNPLGKLTTMNEDKLTGYPNDLPIRNYDFQAPLGEYGQIRQQYRLFKLQHLFLQDFGKYLAPMDSFLPENTVKDPADIKNLRTAIREKDGRGFVFINNYSRKLNMAEQKDIQFKVQSKTGEITFPKDKINIPSGAYFILPFQLPIGNTTLRYATAQLLCKSGNTYFFFAIDGIGVDYEFSNGKSYTKIVPGLDSLISIGSFNIITLSYAQAQKLYKFKNIIYISDADMYCDEKKIYSYRLNDGDLSYYKYYNDKFIYYNKILPEIMQKAEYYEQGLTVNSKYIYELFIDGKKQVIEAVIDLPENCEKSFLEIDYIGDVAQIYCDGLFYDDDFYTGKPWLVGLKDLSGKKIKLIISELKPECLYLEVENADKLKINNIKIKVMYESEMELV